MYPRARPSSSTSRTVLVQGIVWNTSPLSLAFSRPSKLETAMQSKGKAPMEWGGPVCVANKRSCCVRGMGTVLCGDDTPEPWYGGENQSRKKRQ